VEDLFYFCFVAAYILYDPPGRKKMFPLVITRPIADCRLGILTIREKWEKMLAVETSTLTAGYLQSLFPQKRETDNYWINGGLVPDKYLIQALKGLPEDTSLVSGNHILMSRGRDFPLNTSLNNLIYDRAYQMIDYPWQIFQNNKEALENDFALCAKERSLPHLEGVQLIHPENVYIEDGAKVYPATLNATEGSIFIGKDAVIMEGSHLRGPVAIGAHAVVKMGARIYGGTTVGPYCMVGGEVKNSILFGYSNKAHDGYLGDSVIGEWCNLGAGTTCSNLKNTAGKIKIGSREVGLKCGFIMGDFSRTAVETRINSGTTIGVSAHLHETGFPLKEVPDFYWNKEEKYQVDKAIEHAKNWMKLKGKTMNNKMEVVLTRIFNNELEKKKKVRVSNL